MSTTRRVKDVKHAGEQELNGRTVRSIRRHSTLCTERIWAVVIMTK